MERKRRIGVYLSAEAIGRDPALPAQLRDRVGLSLVIIEFAGELPPAVLALNPFDQGALSDASLQALVDSLARFRESRTAQRSSPQAGGARN